MPGQEVTFIKRVFWEMACSEATVDAFGFVECAICRACVIAWLESEATVE